jgi:hypothetical protein
MTVQDSNLKKILLLLCELGNLTEKLKNAHGKASVFQEIGYVFMLKDGISGLFHLDVAALKAEYAGLNQEAKADLEVYLREELELPGALEDKILEAFKIFEGGNDFVQSLITFIKGLAGK